MCSTVLRSPKIAAKRPLVVASVAAATAAAAPVFVRAVYLPAKSVFTLRLLTKRTVERRLNAAISALCVCALLVVVVESRAQPTFFSLFLCAHLTFLH